jgi:acetolactate synthase-1/2/3 large subunit
MGVVLTTSGGGAMNLVHALAEARASRVPVLALVGEPPSDVQGRGAFQDTSGRAGAVDAAEVFRAVAVHAVRVARAEDTLGLLAAAVDAATGDIPGPAVLLLAKDLQRAPVEALRELAGATLPSAPGHALDRTTFHRAASMLSPGPALIIAGDEVARAGATEDLVRLAAALDARVAVAPDARDAFDNRDPRFIGVAGAMGHPDVARALAAAGVCVLVGTRLPLLARQGLEPILREKPLLSIAREAPFVSSGDGLHLGGNLMVNLRGLLEIIGVPASIAPTPSAGAEPSVSPPAGAEWGSPAILQVVERSLPEGGVVVIDAGNTGAQAVHHLRLPRGGRCLIAMGMAGMGYSFGAAVGAALATGRRCTVLAGDGAFFMHGLDIHTAVEHALPITYVIFNNRAHGMCLVRERLLLGEESGYNAFRPSHIGAGLAAMLPGLPACDCRTLGELEEALARANAAAGPSVITTELPAVEVPPFSAFQPAAVAAGGGRS